MISRKKMQIVIILNVGFHTAREYREDSIKKISATNITEAAVKYYEKIKN
jgi:hypothetical protein